MTRSRLIIAAVAVAVAVVVGGFVAYDQVLRGDSATALTLPTASASPAASARRECHRGSAAPAPSADPTAVDGDVAGTWNVAAGSVAGYRVREQLASLSAESDAVGRTDQVTGSITVESDGTTTTLTAAVPDRRHDQPDLRRIQARQPAAPRGPRDGRPSRPRRSR